MSDTGNDDEMSRSGENTLDADEARIAEEVARTAARCAEAAKQRRLAALKAAGIKKGEVRNPTGQNGRSLMNAMRRAMDREGNREALCQIAVEKSLLGDIHWARFCAEYDDGKPAVSIDHTNSDGSMPSMLRVVFTTSAISDGAAKVELVGVDPTEKAAVEEPSE